MAVHRTDSSGRRHLRQAPLARRSSMLVASGAFFRALDRGWRLKNGGAAAYAAGKYDATVRQLSSTIKADNVSATRGGQGAVSPRACLSQARPVHPRHRRSRRGVWLGLSASERTAALVNRGLAYRAAGLKTQGDAEIASARKDDSNGAGRQADREQRQRRREPASSMGAFSTEVRPEGATGDHDCFGRARTSAAAPGP